MSGPDAGPGDAPRPLRNRDGEPAFREAWQAQTLAIADTLAHAGVFSAADWARALGAELAAAGEAPDAPDDDAAYYAAALAALERLLDRNGAATAPDVAARRDAWASAYRNTPHGRPVLLAAASRPGPEGRADTVSRPKPDFV